MKFRRPLALAALGLTTLAAGLVAPAPAPAQTAGDCRVLGTQDQLRISICDMPDPTELKSSMVAIKISVENLATRPIIGGSYDVTDIRAALTTTTAGQVLPDPPTSPPPDGSVLRWDVELPANGQYVLEIEAFGDRPNGSQQAQLSTSFTLVVPPAKPTGVKTSVSEDGRVTVTWTSNAEPDMRGYLVERAPQGKNSWDRVGGLIDAPQTSASDTPPVGGWRYRVLAVRFGADKDSGVLSDPSDVKTADVDSSTTATTAGTSSTSTPSSATGSSTTSGSSSTAAGAGESGATSTTAAGSATVTGGTRNTVDLRNFAASLDAQRRAAAARRAAEPDPGFQETLPFDVRARELVEEPEVEGGDLAEPGGDEPELGIGERLVSDDAGERRRSLGFVATGLLLFVLGLGGLFVKAEVRRADDLEPDLAPEPDLLPEPEPEPLAVLGGPIRPEAVPTRPEAQEPRNRRAARAARAAARDAMFDDAGREARHAADLAPVPAPVAARVGTPTRRVRRTVAPLDAPALDIPEPVVATAPRTRTTNARRTPPRLPSRSADDRREGDPAVRPRRRGAGQGDRRVPVG